MKDFLQRQRPSVPRQRLGTLGVMVILFGMPTSHAAAARFRVQVEYSKAPQCETFAAKSKALIEELYPKINEILFAADHPLETDSITLVCEPMKGKAYTDIQKNRIHVSAAFVTTNPGDYGMVVHELTHIVQHYAKLKSDQVWLQEGIADYIRHRYYDGDIDGLWLKVDPDRDTYRKGYIVTAAFLAWIEKRDHPTMLKDLNRGCAEGHCTADLFVMCCGRDVDVLWSDFVNDLRQARAAKPAN